MLTDNQIVTVTLLRRFMAEAEFDGGDGRYYGMIRLTDGRLFSHHPGSPTLAAEQLMWGSDILNLLNKELHHDGAWVVVFTNPEIPADFRAIDAAPRHWDYGRYALIWLDEDGDPQFTMEWAKGDGELADFTDVLLAGRHSTAEKCEAAWRIWSSTHRALDLKEGQTFKRARASRSVVIEALSKMRQRLT